VEEQDFNKTLDLNVYNRRNYSLESKASNSQNISIELLKRQYRGKQYKYGIKEIKPKEQIKFKVK